MRQFQVPTMTCGHCVATVTRAIQGVDPAAKVAIDLNARILTVESALPVATLSAAIANAGYANTPTA